MWQVKFERRVQKDLETLKRAGLDINAWRLVATLQEDPYAPKFEKLVGGLDGLYSCRINVKHRLLYKILPQERVVLVLSMWSHYE